MREAAPADSGGAPQLPSPPEGKTGAGVRGANALGYLYLLQHGRGREYKIGRTRNPLRREGEVALELPNELEPIHYIKTDDPRGIESYWHARFKTKRKRGEWFALTADDVRAFRRWKRIH
jgi:Meiotically up-regulated gene 113